MTAPETDPELRAALDAAVVGAVHAWAGARRERVEDFARATFGPRGALALHRKALGADLARAPANLALAPVALGARLAAAGAQAAGFRETAERLRGRRLLLETEVSREVRRRVLRDLLELPGPDGRDSLAEAILASAEVRELLAEAAAEAAARRDGKLDATLTEYGEARAAVADLSAGIAALGVGASAFHGFTPGAMSLGPAVAAAVAHQAAVASFPLGATAGGLWYSIVPVAVPAGLLVGATAATMGAAAVAAAFAGVVADPVQLRLGLHQRRLRKLIDAMEAHLAGRDGPGYAAREPYVARLFDVIDAAGAALRVLKG